MIHENHSQLQSWLKNANTEIEKRQQEWIQRIGERIHSKLEMMKVTFRVVYNRYSSSVSFS